MSESGELYAGFKADQQGNVTRGAKPRAARTFHPMLIGRKFVVTKKGREFVVTKRRDFVERRPPTPDEDYSAFKATLSAFAEDLKLEIRDQHEQTRAEVQTVRHEVLSAVRASPSEYVKLVCELVSLFLLFSLAVRFLLKVELVNPAFAVFMLFACALYWCMASLKQRSERKSKYPQA